MKHLKQVLTGIFLVSLMACSVTKSVPVVDDGKLELVLVQVNDVYEIAPLSGDVGGMARVATLKKMHKEKNPNTLLIMAGDFLSPSVFNSLPYEGQTIRGRQMVEAMNAAGMDLVVFGNHEFDIKENELQQRLNESAFTWVASNTFHKTANGVQPFAKQTNGEAQPLPKVVVKTLTDADGTVAKVGFMGITLPFNQAAYVSYTDPLTTAREMYELMKDSVHAVVAITHQLVQDDKVLAEQIPQLALIAGGHEHDMRREQVQDVLITKAHANAKSAFVIKMNIDVNEKKQITQAELVKLDTSIAIDTATHRIVEKWTTIADESFRSLGFDSRKTVGNISAPLDGRETEVRSNPTNLTKMIVQSILYAAPLAEVALMNAGSIRVDDILTPPVTQYDIIRTLPFGGGIREVDMKGSLLIEVLLQGKRNRGIGGFILHNENLGFDVVTQQWKLNNQVIDKDRTYRVAITDFLLSGMEANLGFLNTQNPGITNVYDAATTGPMSDIRKAIIHYLENQ